MRVLEQKFKISTYLMTYFSFLRDMYEIVLVIDTLQLNQQLRKY